MKKQTTTPQQVKAGLKFTSKHLAPITAEIVSIDEANNTAAVRLTTESGSSYIEKDWDLQHTIWGFENGEYQPTPQAEVKIKVGDKMKFNESSDIVTCVEVSKDGKSVKSSGGQWYDMKGTLLASPQAEVVLSKEVLQDKPCEVHKQRHSGIGNVGYGYAILKPLVNKEGEYKGQLGGYHVIAHQDLRLTKEQADSICDSINSCYKLKPI